MMPKARVISIVLTLGVFAFGGLENANAGIQNVNCVAPFVFTEAGVNAIVLPYSYAGQPGRPLSQAGKHLAVLAQLNVLFSILKYDSVGAVQMLVPPNSESECAPEVIIDKIMGRKPGAIQQLQALNGVVILSGNIYEEGGDIFVQSYLHIARRGGSTGLKLTIAGQPFEGQLTGQSFAFAPRKFTVSELHAIEDRFLSSTRVRANPRIEETGNAIPVEDATRDPFSYRVMETRGEWMRIQPEGNAPPGWIRASLDTNDDSSLLRKMPELNFVEAMVGYLAFRVELDKAKRSTILSNYTDRVADAFRRYETASGDRPAPLPLAIGNEALGMMYLLRPGAKPADTEAANHRFDQAAKLAPYDAEARNLQILAKIRDGVAGRRLEPQTTVNNLIGAIAAAPENKALLRNLRSYYLLVQSGSKTNEISGAESIDSKELTGRLQAVEAILQ